MAISSSATGLRPGVCTSTTRPTNPYTGQIIYETDTGYLRVWDGAAWDYLSQKQDNTVGLGPVGGLIYITQTAYSGSSAVNVDNVFTSTYDHYLIVNSCYGSTTNNVRLKYRAGGSTDSSNVYYTQGLYPNANATGYIYEFPVTTGHFLGNYSNNSSYIGTQTISIWNPQLAVRTNMYSQWEVSDSGLGGFQNGMFAANTQFDGFALIANSGNITGTVRVYGYRQA